MVCVGGRLFIIGLFLFIGSGMRCSLVFFSMVWFVW